MDSEPDHKCPYKRKAERGHTENRKSNMKKTEAEIGVMQPQKPRNAHSLLEVEEARSRLSPRVSGRSIALLTPQFHLSKTNFHIMASRIGRE